MIPVFFYAQVGGEKSGTHSEYNAGEDRRDTLSGDEVAGITSEQFYKTKTWKIKRAAILRRDGYMCQLCKRYGRRVDATTVHHIKHIEDAPELALANDNLISLCDKCHNKMHPEKGGYRGSRNR